MSNSYFTNSNPVVKQTLARASQVNANLDSLEAAFDKLPDKLVLDTGRVTYALDTGAADVYAVALHKTATSYYTGMHITMKVATTNTGASTLDVDGIGAKAVKLVNGTDPQAGDLTAGDIVDLVYDGTNFVIISVVRSIINGQAAMSDAEIKTAYENNSNTNAFTDAQQTKVNYLTVTGAINLDEVALGDFFTADGAVTAGKAVELQSDGTVKEVAQTGVAASAGAKQDWNTEDRGFFGVAYDATNQEAIVFYEHNTVTDHLGVEAGSASGETVSWSGELATLTEDLQAKVQGAAASAGTVSVFIYEDRGNADRSTMVALTYNGTTGSLGTPIIIDSTGTTNHLSVCYDPYNDQFIAAYAKGTNGASGGHVRAVTYSGTALTAQIEAQVETGGTDNPTVVYDTVDDVAVVIYHDAADIGKTKGSVVSISGTTLTPNTPVNIYTAGSATDNGSVYGGGVVLSIILDNTNSKMVAVASSVNGTSLDVGSAVDVAAGAVYAQNLGYDPVNDQFLWVYEGLNNSNYLTGVYISVSSLVVTVGTPFVISSTAAYAYIGLVYDTSSAKFILVAGESVGSNTDYFVLTPESLSTNAARWLGLAASSAADTENVSVTLLGGVNDQQSGLTVDETYYITDTGGLDTPVVAGRKCGRAVSATEILIVGGNEQ